MKDSSLSMETIWRDYHIALKKFLHSRLNNPADVDDLLQEVMIKTHNKIATIREESSLKSWLFTLTNNVIMDHYRQQKKAHDLHNELQAYDFSDEQTRHALEQCVAPFIRALPEESRDLLVAVDLERQSQKVVAKEQGIAYSTLKSRVKKGREIARKIFEDCCHLSLDHQGNVMEFQQKSDHCDHC